jgi:hypothetical protein
VIVDRRLLSDFVLNTTIDFFAVHADFFRRCDTQANLIAADAERLDSTNMLSILSNKCMNY